jgi:hypothetical protein
MPLSLFVGYIFPTPSSFVLNEIKDDAKIHNDDDKNDKR